MSAPLISALLLSLLVHPANAATVVIASLNNTTLPVSPRTPLLSRFQGLDANGGWKLFIADRGAGHESRLTSSTLCVNTAAEPSSAALTACGLASLLLVRRHEQLLFSPPPAGHRLIPRPSRQMQFPVNNL